MNRTTAAFALAVPFALAACGSTPETHTYSLTPFDPAAVAPDAPTVDVSVQIAAYLAPSGIVLGEGAHARGYGAHHVWAEPLDVGVARVLEVELARGAAGAARVRDVRVAVEQFHGDESGVVALRSTWSANVDGVDRSGRFWATEALDGDGYEALVEAHHALVVRLARTIGNLD